METRSIPFKKEKVFEPYLVPRKANTRMSEYKFNLLGYRAWFLFKKKRFTYFTEPFFYNGKASYKFFY